MSDDRLKLAAALLALTACAREPLSPSSETARMSVRGAEVIAEIAADPARREQGLMFRREVPDGQGMLFIYPQPVEMAFWMRNTYVPLSIAFLDDSGRVLNIEHMQPFDEVTLHRSAEPCPMALEVPHGWFEAHGIGPGDQFTIDLPKDLWVR